MKKKIRVVAYLIVCSLIIAAAIYNGDKYHTNCGECKLAVRTVADK